jgi:hypothetical protein
VRARRRRDGAADAFPAGPQERRGLARAGRVTAGGRDDADGCAVLVREVQVMRSAVVDL